MAAKAWFKFGNTWEKVSLEGIEDVADLRGAIKLKMAPKLDEYAAADLTIRAALIEDKEGSQAAELDAQDTLSAILDRFGVDNKPFAKSIHFFVNVPPKASTGK